MAQSHTISTLLYCFNVADEVLLMKRAQAPNHGLWSPPGGKLRAAAGESPHACAAREAREELGLSLTPTDLRLTGLISEEGGGDAGHWLMFLFEVVPPLFRLPPPHREGRFGFFRREELSGLALPRTDREMIWPLFWRHRRGFFAARCRVFKDRPDEWRVEESRLPASSS